MDNLVFTYLESVYNYGKATHGNSQLVCWSFSTVSLSHLSSQLRTLIIVTTPKTTKRKIIVAILSTGPQAAQICRPCCLESCR